GLTVRRFSGRRCRRRLSASGAIARNRRGHRMQHWIDRNNDKTQLIVLTDEAVYAETLAPAAATQAVGALEAGRSPAMVFGKEAKHVTLRSMTRVQYDEHDTDIEFHHRD